MLTPRDGELIARYLDGLASEAETAELAGRIQADRECGAAFARACRLDAALGDHFRQEKGAGDVRAIVARINAARRTRRLILVAVAAVALLAAVGLWLAPGPAPIEVVTGKVSADGAEVTRIAYGTRFTVPAKWGTRLFLGDGSRAQLDPDTAAAIHGPSGDLRQAVELFAGGGDFRVTKNKGRFEVRTPVGRVTVLGTEFSVRLLPRKHRDGKGEGGMKARGVLLAVGVLAGAVQVQVGERAVVLGVGQSQVFAGEEERAPRTARIGGELSNVGTDSITIVQRGDRGESTKTLTVDAQTKVVIESDDMEQITGEGGTPTYRVKLVDGTLANLKAGRRVTVTCTEDGKATLIVLNRTASRREGGEGEPRVKVEKPRREGGESEGRPRVEKPRREGGDTEGEPRREKPRTEGGDREGEPRREKARTEGGEGEGKPRREKVRTEGGDGEGEKPRPEAGAGDAEGEKPRPDAGEGDREGEGRPRVEKPRTEGGDREGEARVKVEKPRTEGGEGERAPKPKITTGILAGVKADSITVAIGGEKGGGQTLTFTVDAATKVGIEGERTEGGREGADPVKRPVLLTGTLDDLRAGQRVSVQATPEGKATRIFIYRSQTREGEGGERRRPRGPEGGVEGRPRGERGEF